MYSEKTVMITLQVRPAGQAGYPISLVASLDTVPVKCCVPLQTYKTIETDLEVLHLFRCYAHTHTPGRSQVNPERHQEEKSGHKQRAEGQNSAGGWKGTNGPPRRDGPNQHRAHI